MAQEARIRPDESQSSHPVAKDATRMGHSGFDDAKSETAVADRPAAAAHANGPVAVSRNNDNDSAFAVSVGAVYEGPLDLLLDLVRKQDIDIYDIPIAKITAQYLGYVENLKQLDVDIAAEFIYMASLLIHIKSKMLLPRDPDLPAGE